MIVNVELVDGRVFQFASRNDLGRVLDNEPGSDQVRVPGWLRRPGQEFFPLGVSFIRRALVATVVDAAGEAAGPADLPAKEEADRRAAAYAARRPAEAPVAA